MFRICRKYPTYMPLEGKTAVADCFRSRSLRVKRSEMKQSHQNSEWRLLRWPTRQQRQDLPRHVIVT